QHGEYVVPRVNGGEVQDREADPKARVAVAPGLEIEARDRDEQDREVGLRHHAAEDRADRVGKEVGHRGENEAGDQGLARDRALLTAPAVADHVTQPRDREAHGGDDVVLPVDRDSDASDGEAQVGEDAARRRILDRGRRQEPRQFHRGGQPRPALSTSMSLWSAASPTTQARTGPPCVRTSSMASSSLRSLCVVTATAAPTRGGGPASTLRFG